MNLTNPAKVKKKKLAKAYTYFIHETQSGKNEGDVVIKRYGIINPDDEIFASKKSPKEIKTQQQLYNKGLIGISDRTGIDYYAQTIEYGRQGGLKSNRRIWANEAEKQQAKRAKKKLLEGKELNNQEKALLTKAGLVKPEVKEPTKSQRTAAYKYHSNRAATAAERKARWKTKQNQKKAIQQAEKEEVDWLISKL